MDYSLEKKKKQNNVKIVVPEMPRSRSMDSITKMRSIDLAKAADVALTSAPKSALVTKPAVAQNTAAMPQAKQNTHNVNTHPSEKSEKSTKSSTAPLSIFPGLPTPELATAALKSDEKPVEPRVYGAAAPEKKSRTYTMEDIKNLTTTGYIDLDPILFEYIPNGAYVRYVKKDDGSGLSFEQRFRGGGYVKFHYEKNSEKFMVLENRPGGNDKNLGYVSFIVAYNKIEKLWKKFDKDAYIELYMISNSMANKEKQIRELNAKVYKLEQMLVLLQKAIINLNK